MSLGTESLRAGIVDAAGDLHHGKEEGPLANQLDLAPDNLLSRIRRLSASVLSSGLEDPALRMGARAALPLLGVAIAWPSALDRGGRPAGRSLRHVLWTQPEVPGAGALPLSVRTSRAFGDLLSPDRCHALNDANADALAVAFDQARARASEPDDAQWRVALVVHVGGRISVGTITLGPHRQSRLSFVDARLISGTRGFAGELGHLPVAESIIRGLDEDNPYRGSLAPIDYDAKCSCGRRHHLEALAGADAFFGRLTNSGYAIPADGQAKANLVRSTLAGELEPRQIHALSDVGRVLGGALCSPILMLDPFSITLTGPLATKAVRDGILLEREAVKSAIGDAVDVGVMDGEAGGFVGVRGAALAVLRRFVYRAEMDGHRSPTRPLAFDRTAVAALTGTG